MAVPSSSCKTSLLSRCPLYKAESYFDTWVVEQLVQSHRCRGPTQQCHNWGTTPCSENFLPGGQFSSFFIVALPHSTTSAWATGHNGNLPPHPVPLPRGQVTFLHLGFSKCLVRGTKKFSSTRVRKSNMWSNRNEK